MSDAIERLQQRVSLMRGLLSDPSFVEQTDEFELLKAITERDERIRILSSALDYVAEFHEDDIIKLSGLRDFARDVVEIHKRNPL